jgi:hypothetical protein
MTSKVPSATQTCRVCSGEPIAPWPPKLGDGPTHHTCHPGEERRTCESIVETKTARDVAVRRATLLEAAAECDKIGNMFGDRGDMEERDGTDMCDERLRALAAESFCGPGAHITCAYCDDGTMLLGSEERANLTRALLDAEERAAFWESAAKASK